MKEYKSKFTKTFKKRYISKNIGVIVLGILPTIMLSACNEHHSTTSDMMEESTSSTPGTGTTTKPTTPSKPTTPEIPKYFQEKRNTYSNKYPSDYFSSKTDYLRFGSDYRFINLQNTKVIYLRYQEGIDQRIITELKNIGNQLETMLKGIDPSFDIRVEPGSFNTISGWFIYDSLYFYKPDTTTQQQFSQSNTLATTRRSGSAPPVIMLNTNEADSVVVKNKHISLNQIMLHEIMHCFGYNHSVGAFDIMRASTQNYRMVGSKYFYEKNNSRYYVSDYLKFSDDEAAAIVQQIIPSASFEQKCLAFEKFQGIDTRQSYYQTQAEVWSSKYYSSNPGVSKSKKVESNQIISMKSRDNSLTVTLNSKHEGMYSCITKHGRQFEGRYYLTTTNKDGKYYQFIVLENFPVPTSSIINQFSHETMILKINSNYFEQVESSWNMQFQDNTSNYAKENGLKQSATASTSTTSTNYSTANTTLSDEYGIAL